MKRVFLTSVTLGLALAILSGCARPTGTPMPTFTATPPPTQAHATPITATPTPAQVPPTAVVASPTPSAVSPQTPADWPMFRFGLNRAGYNPTETVLRPPLELKWQFDAEGKI